MCHGKFMLLNWTIRECESQWENMIFSGLTASFLCFGDNKPNTRNTIDVCHPVNGAYV